MQKHCRNQPPPLAGEYVRAKLGSQTQEDVASNDVLGKVLSPFGDELETVRSPVDGVVLGMYTYGYVTPHETISELGHDVHAEKGPA